MSNVQGVNNQSQRDLYRQELEQAQGTKAAARLKQTQASTLAIPTRAAGATPGASAGIPLTAPETATGQVDYGSASHSMGQMAQLGFLLFELEGKMLSLANKERKENRDNMAQSGEEAYEAGIASSEKQKSGAVSALAGAVSGSAVALVGAGIQFGGSVKTGVSRGGSALDVSNSMAKYQAFGQGMNSLGQMASAGGEYESKVEQSESTRDEAAGSMLKSVEQTLSSDAADQQQLLQSILKLGDTIDEGEHQSSEHVVNDI